MNYGLCGWVVLFCTAGLTAAQGVPQLLLSQDSWDFGQVWHPESVTLALVVRNAGTADLHLKDVRSTCGCTVAEPARKVVPPGESTEIQVRFDTLNKQKDVHSKVIIDSDDPQRPTVEFPIKGHVLRAILREPHGGLTLKAIESRIGLSASIQLKNQLPEPMKLELVRCDIAGLDVQVSETVPGREANVTIRTVREMPAGTTRGKILFRTGLPREPEFAIPVQVRILGLAEAMPAAIYLDDKRPVPERDVSIYYYGQRNDFQLVGWECSHPGVQVVLGKTEHPPGMNKLNPPVNAVARVKVKLPAPADVPKEGIQLKVKTNDPDCPQLEVLITTSLQAYELKTYGAVGLRDE